jgi:glutamyl endopeptidase
MKRFCILLMTVLFFATGGFAWAIPPNTAVSDDGTEMLITGMEAELDVVETKPFKGSGVISKGSLTYEGVVTTPGESLSELGSLPPVSADVGIETVIGSDTRVRTYPNTFPRRAVVLITFSAGRCSGWLIGKDTVITAGHCVHKGGGGSANWYPRSSYKIYPGKNAASSPYGYCTAKSLRSVTGWTNSKKDDYDYGAIKLNCTVGNSTGWFGYYWKSKSLKHEPTIITGYPGDKTNLSQWESVDKVRVNQTRRVFYKNDTYGGMSGSPVWNDRYGTGGAYAFGIHNYGLYNGAPYSTHNHATRINQAVFNNLKYWKNLP